MKYMNKQHHKGHAPTHHKEPSSPVVEVTIVFRDALNRAIKGLAVRIAAGTGAPPAPPWTFGPDTDQPPASDASMHVAAVENSLDVTTDGDGYALTIQNAARNQPLDVLVKNRHGQYVLKATVTPTKDVTSYVINSPEYHLEAVTQPTPQDAFEQDLTIPIVKDGEVMTVDRLLNEFGPYVGSTQKVTEQGKVKKDFPAKKKEVHIDPATGKQKTSITIEHHYRVVDTGKPRTIAINLLASRLSYPKSSLLTDQHFTYLATSFGCEAAAVKALNKQETVGNGRWSPDGGFDPNGLPRILFERHHFYGFTLPTANKKTGKRTKNPYVAFPDICFPKPGAYGPSGIHQYEKLVKAAKLDRDAAIKSCSWGAFQILGEYYDYCNCSSPVDMANRSMESIDAQVKLFEAFMKKAKPSAIAALAHKKWEDLAFSFNGSHWKKQNPNYAKNLEEFYNDFK
ncbi:N-acetylmuramidase family protein [Paraburkholderia phytofirmans]|uniref:N-acetylmuramidase family protein n=1 Tax=Paraburkholderia phytofirmans TaxID=261302 RepID=A0ABW9BEH3_9BURK